MRVMRKSFGLSEPVVLFASTANADAIVVRERVDGVSGKEKKRFWCVILSLFGSCVLALGTALPAQAGVITANITTTWYEPECEPNSIFVGSFSYDTSTHAVTNLKGKLSEAMEGGVYNPATSPSPADGIVWLSLNNQLANGDASHKYTWHDDALNGTFATVFLKTDSLTFYTGSGGDGWSPQSGVNVGGRYAGWPALANNAQNAYALIFVPDDFSSANPISLAWDEDTGIGDLGLAHTAYADFTAEVHDSNGNYISGGMMNTVGMTATSARVYGAVGTMEGYPLSEVIRTVPEPSALVLGVTALAAIGFHRLRRSKRSA